MMSRYMDDNTRKKIDVAVKNILDGIQYDGSSMLDTNDVLKYISRSKGIHIRFIRKDFTRMGTKIKNFAKMGAYTLMDGEGNKKSCTIVLNSAHNVVYQRFSLAHEIGHIWLEDFPKNEVTLSTHINYKLFSIDDEVINHNKNLTKEQDANIFALKLLMPEKTLFKKAREIVSFRKLAEFFGVEEAALLSRIELLGD